MLPNIHAKCYRRIAVNYMKRGEFHYRNGNISLAETFFSNALHFCKLDGMERSGMTLRMLLFKRVQHRMKCGMHREANEDARELLRVNGKDINGHFVAAVCYMQIGEFATALASLTRADALLSTFAVIVKALQDAVGERDFVKVRASNGF